MTKAILVTTQHRGVFYAEVAEDMDLSTSTLKDLKNARMAINWRNGKGVMGLAGDGPDSNCKIGVAADIDILHDVTAVFSVTDKAKEKWIAA